MLSLCNLLISDPNISRIKTDNAQVRYLENVNAVRKVCFSNIVSLLHIRFVILSSREFSSHSQAQIYL